MKLPIRLRSEVIHDLTQAADWYDKQRAGLGAEFAEEAYAAFEALAERPHPSRLCAGMFGGRS